MSSKVETVANENGAPTFPVRAKACRIGDAWRVVVWLDNEGEVWLEPLAAIELGVDWMREDQTLGLSMLRIACYARRRELASGIN